MNDDQKERACRFTYWGLFIIAPTLAVTFVGSWTRPRIGWALPVFILLVFVGEHAYRWWARKVCRLKDWDEVSESESDGDPNNEIHGTQ